MTATALDAARAYLARGWQPIPVPFRAKDPNRRGWQKLQLTLDDLGDHFDSKSQNVGILLGDPSGGLVDVDLDCPEALRLARVFLPRTDASFGRKSKPGSHRLYVAGRGVRTSEYEDLDGTMLVELRGTGGQTVVPPSTHPSGEPIAWERAGDPATVELSDLSRAVRRLAAACLVARHYPAAGSRHRLALALAGALLRAGWSVDEAQHFVGAVASAAGDDEADDRIRCVETTHEKIEAGEAVTGTPTLAELLDAKLTRKLAGWLELRGENASARRSDPADDGKRERKSKPGALIKLALEHCEAWHTSDDDAFATIQHENHREHYAIRSRDFRRWLAHAFYESTRAERDDGDSAGQSVTGEDLAAAILALEGQAVFDGAQYDVYTRIASLDDKIYVDLCDERWRAIEVDAAGWRVVDDPPVRFRRARGMLALPEPTRGGSLDELREFVNVPDDAAWALVKAWLVAALAGDGPTPVLALSGEQGSAKSTLARFLRALIDPATPGLRRPPRDERDLAIAARANWIVAFDNVSQIQPWLSDALCNLVTGGGFATRELYTDFDEVLFSARRPVILTGIEDYVERGDLADRAIKLTLPPIADDERRDEKTLLVAFEEAKPRLFAALLDSLAGALRELPRVKLERMPRMADFSRLAVAAERGRGEAPTFLAAYVEARREAESATIEASIIGPVLLQLCETGDWSGTASELLVKLADLVDEKTTKNKHWPATPRGLAGELRRLAPALRRAGYDVIFANRTGKARLIHLQKSPSRPSQPSQPSQTASDQAKTSDGLVTQSDGLESRPSLDRHLSDGRLTASSSTVTRPSPVLPHPDAESDCSDGSDDVAAASAGGWEEL